MRRSGAAGTLDYVLVLGVILPLAAFIFWAGPRIMVWPTKWSVCWSRGRLCNVSRSRYEEDSLLGASCRIHQDEEGSVSLETVLIIGAIALPILIFLIKVGWPQDQGLFQQRHQRP